MAISQATTADLTTRSLRPLTTVETQWGTVRLRDSFNRILVKVPGIAAKLDAGVVSNPINQLVIQTQVDMVLRVLSNPDGVLEETIDDYTRRLDASVSAGALYVSDTEIADLRSALTGGRSSRGAFTIRPFRPAA
jgi:hypothetical protein